ncbi:MAG: aldo/keto reductase [Candidatus Korarchaeum sp.]|jgi:diketogulonate reductase-like aldo/keto reductase|nr:aldo/keto reductase [Candidatus Korarchaeum sp.]
MIVDLDDRKELGRTGERVAAIGIGTWGIRDKESARKALRRAIELGLNQIDTAEMYSTEGLVGEVVREFGRDEVFVTTKLLPKHFKSEDSVIKAARESLRRLGLDKADLILIHWPNEGVSIKEQIRYLERVAEVGICRHIGVSNFDVRELEEAISSTRRFEIVVNQVKYSPIDRRVEKDLLPFCIEHGITIQAYTPLEGGNVTKSKILRDLAVKYGKTPVQIALNYLISHERVTAIPKTERVERVEEFRGALGWRLEVEDLLAIHRGARVPSEYLY